LRAPHLTDLNHKASSDASGSPSGPSFSPTLSPPCALVLLLARSLLPSLRFLTSSGFPEPFVVGARTPCAHIHTRLLPRIFSFFAPLFPVFLFLHGGGLSGSLLCRIPVVCIVVSISPQ
jgi:hypothetical protein